MHTRRAARAVIPLALLALLLRPGVVAAHSELLASDPADGSTLTASPTEITGDFSEALDPTRSSMELRSPDGARIGTGGVPADGPDTRMAITGIRDLGPGTYDVRWTTVTPDDDGVERGTFTFTVGAGASPAPTATAAASAAPGATGVSTPGPATPPVSETARGTGAGDLLVPLLALAVVLAGGAAVLLRRRR
jgi:methionine-rich copper-binding protein CopC